jgi:hypothetical protein
MNLKDVLTEYPCGTLGFPSDKTLEALEAGIVEGSLEDLLTGEHYTVKAPLYHKLVGKNLHTPILEEYVPYLQAMIQVRYSKAITYKECTEHLTEAGFHVSSTGQLSNIFNRMETKLGLRDKKRKVPRFVPTSHKKQLASARKVVEGNKAVRKAKKDMINAKAKVARQAAKQGLTLGQHKAKAKVEQAISSANVTEDLKNQLPPKLKSKKVLYEPTPKQAEFHAAGERIVLYGGAAGGGKSYSMLVDALRYCQYEDYRALIIRKSSPMLKELIGVSRNLYKKAFPGAKFNKQESVWYFPSGATIEFGYLDKPEDLERYQGLPYAYIGFDEIQHQRTPEGFQYLMSRLRSANPAITCYMRASANPGGASWVKELFINPAPPGTTFWKDGLSWKFIPARLEDNPYLDKPEDDGSGLSAYRKMLMALPETQRKQLLEGDWLAGDDNMFAFIPDLHVTSEDPPLHWNQIRGMDYGYRDPASTIWSAVSPDNVIVVYDEHEVIEVPAVEWAREILAYERRNQGGFDTMAPFEEVIDWSVFKNVGNTGPGILEQVHRLGMRPRPADRAREAGWNQIHNRLLTNEDKQPTLLIHERCEKLIDQVQSAKVHSKNPDDIDDLRVMSKGRKHHWDLLDTLRYTCMARPSTMSFQDRSLKYKFMGDPLADTWAKFGR